MDVVLINPPNVFDETDGSKKKGYTIYPPGGLISLATMLKMRGFTVKIIDLLVSNNSLDETVDYINKLNPKVIGISSTTPQIRGAYQLAKELKVRKIGGQVCIGGAHVSADPEFANRFSDYFDFAIIGEAEITFPEVVARIKEGEIIKGIIKGDYVQGLDSLPFPDRDLIKIEDYYLEPYESKFATVHTIRGCPFNCSFCSKSTRTKTRFRDPLKVVDEIEKLITKYKIEYVLFTDDTFTLKKERVVLICEEIIKRKLKFKWGCETRANLIDRDLVTQMKMAGCIEIAFGVETGNESIRQEVIKKQISNSDIINAFSLCKEFEIIAVAFCMLGFPGETEEQMYETLTFAKKISPDIVSFHLTVPMPGSIIYETAIHERKISSNYWDEYAKGKQIYQPVYLPNSLTRERMEKIQKKLYRGYYLTPRYILKRILKHPHQLLSDINVGIGLLLTGKTGTGRI